MFGWIAKIIPALGGILGNVLGGTSEKADELRAQAELEEAKAFSRGRYAPRYVLKYTLILIFFLFCMVLFASMLFPFAVDLDHPLDTIERLAKTLFSLGDMGQ